MNRFLAIACTLSLALSAAIAVNIYAADITFTITVSDANGKAAAILDAFVKQHGWTATIPDPANPGQTIPNPVTRAQHGKSIIQLFIKESAKAYRANQEAEKARATEAATAETETVFK